MAVFDFYSDREQEMQSEGQVLVHEAKYPTQGKCLACLRTDAEIDADGLCERCDPVEPETRAALIALLNTNGQGAQEK